MNVFIEAERNSKVRARYHEQSLELLGKFVVSKPYPFAYGFILGTWAPARDALDCFVITNKNVRLGESIECDPVDAFIQNEGDEEDVKVIAVDFEDQPDYGIKKCVDEIQAFILEIFKDSPEIKISFGPLLGKEKTCEIINAAPSNGRATGSVST